MPYETRANVETTSLLLERSAFEELLATHPHVSRPWLTSVSQRLARSHSRLTSLLGQPLEVQVAQLLLEERVENVVNMTQAMVAAPLGVHRPSVNRVLARFAERDMVEVSYGKCTSRCRGPRSARDEGVTAQPAALGALSVVGQEPAVMTRPRVHETMRQRRSWARKLSASGTVPTRLRETRQKGQG